MITPFEVYFIDISGNVSVLFSISLLIAAAASMMFGMMYLDTKSRGIADKENGKAILKRFKISMAFLIFTGLLTVLWPSEQTLCKMLMVSSAINNPNVKSITVDISTGNSDKIHQYENSATPQELKNTTFVPVHPSEEEPSENVAHVYEK